MGYVGSMRHPPCAVLRGHQGRTDCGKCKKAFRNEDLQMELLNLMAVISVNYAGPYAGYQANFWMLNQLTVQFLLLTCTVEQRQNM